MGAKKVLQQIAPPFVWTVAHRVRQGLQGRQAAYDTYDEALAAAGGPGYDVEAVAEGTVAQFAREAETVRGRFPFADVRTIRQLAAMWRVRDALGGKPLRVLDVGGQVGVHFQRLRVHLPENAIAAWDVVETGSLARLAKAKCTEPGLRFFEGLESLPAGDYDVAFSSGTLQAVPDPWAFFESVGSRAKWLLLDRIPFGAFERDRLMVLRNALETYRVAIPIWFFAETTWLERFAASGWKPVLRWRAPEETITFDGVPVEYSGLLLQR
ncbi:MAG TPA: methyltransferase, TIGR04325 family [Kofleriaceae bacterium]|nr:methyltransferase, TIGR04325 family [Kofleriaceae bacterium]